MTTKHTPGPWYTSARSNNDYQSEVAQEGTGKTVAVTYTSNDADARLIAKAPEMLEALRALGSLPVHTQGCNQMLTTEYFNAILLARAIINEIEGE